MKLLLPIIVLFLCPPPPRRTPLAVTAELCLQPQKNQPQPAGFLFLHLIISCLTALLLHPASCFPLAPFPNLFIQSPNNL